MNCIVVGAGIQGEAVIYGMLKLGFEVFAFDTNPDRESQIRAKLHNIVDTNKLRFPQNLSLLEFIIGSNSEFNVLISCAPYFENAKIHKICDDFYIPYCDLGGNINASLEIQKATKNAPTFTDLGLAPGYINIIAEEVYRKYKPNSIKMMVGGLPQNPPKNALNYAQSFSLDGLIGEYSGDCEIIRNGLVTNVPALSEIEYIDDNFECFHTSGGTAHSIKSFASKGLKNLEYKTIRYHGHGTIMNYLLNQSGLTKEDVKKCIQHSCPPCKDDQIIIGIDYDRESLMHVIKSDNKFTAMQKMTAFPVCSVACMMTSDGLGPSKVLTYNDIDWGRMMTILCNIDGNCKVDV